MENTAFERKVKAGFLTGMAITLAVGAVAFASVGRLVDSAGMVAHTQEVLLAAESAMGHAHAAESRQRAFLVTLFAQHYDEYYIEADSVRANARRLRALVADNPQQSDRAMRLESLLESRLAGLDASMERRLIESDGPADAESVLDHASLVEAVAGLARAIGDGERALLAERSARQARTADAARLVILFGMLVSSAIMMRAMRENSRGIEARRAAEAAMRHAKDQAEAGSRAKSDFLATMSHELRTPLNSIIGFAQLMQKNKAGNLQARDLTYLEKVSGNGRHLLELINNILDVSKIESGRMTLEIGAVDVCGLVREVASGFETQAAERKLELRVEAPDGLSAIAADRGKLKQVLINLAGNALKFTEQGSVTLRVLGGGGRPAVIEVEDTGVGIPPERQQAIFEPFQQADNSITRRFGGTGLGLTISRSLLGLMGFGLDLRSDHGRGTTFRVSLANAAPPPAAPNDWSAASGSTVADARPLILVIDDDADARLLLVHMLEESGYHPVTAPSGAEGLRLARVRRPAAVILDLLMPGMDGSSTMRAFRADPDLDGIPFIVASIVAGEQKGSLPGVARFLDKPLDKARLSAVLGEILGRVSNPGPIPA